MNIYQRPEKLTLDSTTVPRLLVDIQDGLRLGYDGARYGEYDHARNVHRY